MSARLTSQVLVSSLIRRAEVVGGFGAVLAKGDATAGAILLILAERGSRNRLLERLLLPDGEEAARGTGTFMRSHIPLSSLDGYRAK